MTALVAAVAVATATVVLPGAVQRVPAGSGWVTARDELAGTGGAATLTLGHERELETLLRHRARAVRTRNESAFLATVDPQAPASFRQWERAVFRNLIEVPLSEWSYEVNAADATRVPPSLDGTWAPPVTLKYALAGVDRVPTRRPAGYVFAFRHGSWYVTSEKTGSATASRWRGPWDFGACRVLRTGSGLILGHDENRPLARRVARALDSSVAAVSEVWGDDWGGRVGVLIPRSREELRAMVGSKFAVDGIAAVAVADRVDRGRVEGPRVVLNPATASRLSDDALRIVLRHEITHVAARGATASDAAMWMLEGFADYIGYRDSGLAPASIAPDLARQVGTTGPPTALPSDRDFQRTGQQLDLAYQQSWSMAHFLANRFGQRRLVELYHRIAGTNSESAVESSVRRATGMSLDQLVAAWRADLPRVFR